MSTPEQIELAEDGAARFREVCHMQGLNYWEIEGIFLHETFICHTKASEEYREKQD